MSELSALFAAFVFSISHILIRRGLATSNPIAGSFFSIALSALTLWIVAALFIPLQSFWTHAIWFFAVSGIFAPGLGRMFIYIGINRIGVARSVPVSSSSPMFASFLAMIFIGETWSFQNIAGTCLVILGVVIITRTRTEQAPWRKKDLVFPIMAAFSFALASNLRKYGLLIKNLPLMGATVNTTTGLLLAMGVLQAQGGVRLLRVPGQTLGWLIAAGACNTIGMLLSFYALSLGKLVVVEPLLHTAPVLSVLLTALFLRDVEVVNLRVVAGAACTVAGTVLIFLL
ncbi:MAG: DMT family transporter [Candidatus Binatia bacterium]|jgi:uncharacterized membrane protein|nr:DMT family transporter [Candidatus Binatia bacterium]